MGRNPPAPEKELRYTLWKCDYCESLNKIGDYWKCQDCGAARKAAKPADCNYEEEQVSLKKFREKYPDPPPPPPPRIIRG